MKVEHSWVELVFLLRVTTEIPHPLHHMRMHWEGTGYEPGRRPSPEYDHTGPLILDFSASGTVRNKFLLFISYPVFIFCYSSPKGLRQALRITFFMYWWILLVKIVFSILHICLQGFIVCNFHFLYCFSPVWYQSN